MGQYFAEEICPHSHCAEQWNGMDITKKYKTETCIQLYNFA